MVRSLASLLAVNPGFNPRDFFTAGLSLPNQRYSKPEQIVQFFSAVQERIVKLPGIGAAAFTSAPEFDVTSAANIAVDGQSSQATGLATLWPQICIITPGFFRAAGIPILEGRDFSPADILSGEKTAIVSQAFANYFWPRQSPLGKRLGYGQQGWREVVGVVGDVRQEGLAAPSLPEVYLPMTQDIADGETAMNIVVRSSIPTALLAREVEQQVWAVDSGIPLSRVRSGSQLLGQWAGYLRYRTVLLGSFAAIGLLIAVIGVFGAISYTTAQRTHEMGIRMVLGAQRRDMFRLIALQGARLVLIGLTMGIVGALILTRLITSLLYGVTPSDPFTFVSVAVLLMLVALVACYIPARQAMRVDPMIALRYE
jgi:putative ABC transport system permease protein